MFGADMFEMTDKMRKEFVEQALAGVSANALIAITLGIIEARNFASRELSKMIAEGKCGQDEIDDWIFLGVSQWDEDPALSLYKILSEAKFQFTSKQLEGFLRRLQRVPKVGDEIKALMDKVQ